jgi:hypothetical protein
MAPVLRALSHLLLSEEGPSDGMLQVSNALLGRSLHLSGVPVCLSGARTLIPYITHAKMLRIITLRECKLKCEGMQLLMKQLVADQGRLLQQLHHLDLSGNDAACECPKMVLRALFTMTHLDLSGNSFENVAPSSMQDYLIQNYTCLKQCENLNFKNLKLNGEFPPGMHQIQFCKYIRYASYREYFGYTFFRPY